MRQPGSTWYRVPDAFYDSGKVKQCARKQTGPTRLAQCLPAGNRTICLAAVFQVVDADGAAEQSLIAQNGMTVSSRKPPFENQMVMVDPSFKSPTQRSEATHDVGICHKRGTKRSVLNP